MLVGRGDGTFTPEQDVAVTSPTTVAIGDLDRDGKRDVIGASSSIYVRLGNGDGTFRAMPDVAFAATEVFLADLDGDGVLDIVARSEPAFQVAAMHGNGDGTFRSATVVATIGQVTSSAVGDLDRDGRADVAIGRLDMTVTVRHGLSDSTLGPPTDYAVGTQVLDLALGDLDRNGTLDLAVAGSPSSVVLLGREDGTFSPPTTFGLTTNFIAIGDVDGDGIPDVVLQLGSTVAVQRGNGDGTVGPAIAFAAGLALRALILSDLDRDGRMDVIVVNSAGVTVMLTRCL
jgi:hypothetical protein